MSREFEDFNLGSLELFCLVAELGSFTAAATAAGLTPPAVSRTVARLEERLGARLFTRNTRNVRLTDGGSAYYAQCRQALSQLAEAERFLTGQQAQASGTVRLSLPTSYGHYRVLPLLGEFRALHPGVRLEVQLSNQNVDLLSDGYDLAVRARVLPDSGLVARKLEDADLVIVASPAYLDRKGPIRGEDDLARHECIFFSRPSTGQPTPWLLRKEDRVVEWVHGDKGLTCLEDINGPVTLARSGAGVVQTYRFMVEGDLAQGRLVEVLPEFGGTSRPFSLVYPTQRHVPQRVKALIDFLVGRLAT